MGLYQYIQKAWKQPKQGLGEEWQRRLIEWRREPTTIRVERPTRLDRARALGYRAKPGIVIVRQRVGRGGRQRPQIRAGRRPKRFGRRKNVGLAYQAVAEQRASKKYPNCEVLNSYYVGQDGLNFWYEIILVDRVHPAILSDKKLNWISTKKGRVNRGLTSAGRKSRGLRNKGLGAEKVRPSMRANKRRAN